MYLYNSPLALNFSVTLGQIAFFKVNQDTFAENQMDKSNYRSKIGI